MDGIGVADSLGFIWRLWAQTRRYRDGMRRPRRTVCACAVVRLRDQGPYSDVVVHEAAHLLHYLKPRHYGLHVRRGQERFVDVDFCHYELFAFACEAYSRVVLRGDRKSRISFAEKMREGAISFPRSTIEEVAALVMNAAHARNGWRVIREATVIHRIRRRVKTVAP